MGVLSSIADFFKDLFDDLIDLLQKVWEELRPIIAVLVAVAIIVLAFSGGGAFLAGMTGIGAFSGLSLSWWAAIPMAIGSAAMIDPETTSESIDKVGDALGNAAGEAGEVVGEGTGGVADGLLTSDFGTALAWGAGILLTTYVVSSFMSSSDDSKEKRANNRSTERDDDSDVIEGDFTRETTESDDSETIPLVNPNPEGGSS